MNVNRNGLIPYTLIVSSTVQCFEADILVNLSEMRPI